MSRTDNCLQFGVLLSLVLLIVARLWSLPLYGVVIATLGLALLVPRIYAWPARWWMWLGQWIGQGVSVVILLLLYLCVVVPISCLRRFMGSDTLQVRHFPKQQTSAFADCNQTFTAAELEKQF